MAADLTSYTSKEGKDIIILRGEIAPGDTEKLRNLIVAANQGGRMVSGVRLTSNGGNLLEGVNLADVIRTAKIATVVPNGSKCASACFIAFAAGQEKFVSYQANVGVHGAADQNGKEAGDATVAMAKIVKELGVPPSIIGRMVVTPPTEVVWLSPSELQSMGVKMTGKPSQLEGSPGGTLALDATHPKQVPSASAPTTSTGPVNWSQFIERAVALSAAQHGGNPSFNRNCQPEMKVCNMAIFFRSEKGIDMMAHTVEDLHGKMIIREICEFNSFGDNRLCVNFDTKQTHRDLRDAQGNWTQVSTD
jgi:ATP-dependent protease ClpP protease subunit